MTTDEDNIRYYTGGSGIPFGLKIELFLDKSQYKTNIKINDGFEVLVRDGYDYPDMKMYANSLLVGDMLTIGLSPQVLKSDPEVKDVYEPIRGCWFTDEGNLESSYIYSFSSCLVECMARTINEFCKCVPYFYPLSSNELISRSSYFFVLFKIEFHILFVIITIIIMMIFIYFRFNGSEDLHFL